MGPLCRLGSQFSKGKNYKITYMTNNEIKHTKQEKGQYVEVQNGDGNL